MKKVFAILSVFALMIALVGLSVKPAVKADAEKWTVDPTLSENEIPMYIMDSIMSTFPNYYDNNTEPDKNWEGTARMYPWNETRLQVRQMDDSGKFTGKEYAIFFAGALGADDPGAGSNILFFDKDGENVVAKRMYLGGWQSTGQAMDPSLSHMRKNLANEAVTFAPKDLGIGGEGDGYYNRLLVFDAEGRMVRGIMGTVAYQKAGTDGALEDVFLPEYCLVDGVTTKYEEGVVCDKVKTAKLNDEGEPEIDETTGEPIMVETDDDAFLYTRFLWQWVSAEEFDADSVNTVPYLSEGWDATKWDYATAEESSNGYILICFLPSENSTVNLTADQIAVYTAAGLEAPLTRTCAEKITVPAGGFSYDFGYLDKGKSNLYKCFVDMFTSGYYFGRTVDEEGKGMARQATYNFSVSPLIEKDVVAGGVSYQKMAGQNTIEVLQGEKFNPAKNVVYTGVSRYWAVPNDVTSYKAATDVLDMSIVVNGNTEVAPKTGYNSFADMVADFLKDWNAYCDEVFGENAADHYITVTPSVDQTDEQIVADFYNKLGWDLASTGAKADAFTGMAKYWNKWKWMFEFIVAKCAAAGVTTVNWSGTGAVASPGSSRDALWGFLAESPKRSIAGTWANTCLDFSNGVAREWLDERTNLEMWNEFAIDTAVAPVDTNYDVVFKVKNKDTNIESELAIKYVVVDEYTPILEVNKNNLIFTPRIEAEKLVIDPIDSRKLCSAFNGAYNGNIKGSDISYKIHYESETLDFNKPTEGDHLVKAVVYSASGAKFASASFVVSIEDMTAPRVFTRDLVLAYGSYYVPHMGITYAFDAVDGNLMNNDFRGWWTDTNRTIVDVKKPGKYTQRVDVSDRSGNVTSVSFEVVILEPAGASSTANTLTDLQDSVDALKADIAKVQTAVDNLKAAVDANASKAAESSSKKCGSKSAVLVELLAAVSLLGVFLRKRH